jgi:hypothetical protein
MPIDESRDLALNKNPTCKVWGVQCDPGWSAMGVGEHRKPLDIQRFALRPILQPHCQTDDVIRSSTTSLDDALHLPEHVAALLLQGRPQLPCLGIGSADQSAHQQRPLSGSSRNRIGVLEAIDLNGLAQCHGRFSG